MDSKSYVIFGYSGHAYVVIDALHILNRKVTHYVTQEPEKSNPFNLLYAGNDENFHQHISPETCFGILAIGNNHVRKIIYEKVNPTIVFDSCYHTSSIVSKLASLDVACFLGANTIINPYAKIGIGCIINTGAIIEHECNIGDFTHVAPGAVLAGNVKVGGLSFIGANAVVKQGITIGNNVTIGAGTVVLKDIPDNVTVVGNPGKIIK